MSVSNLRYRKPANAATRTHQEARICYGKASGEPETKQKLITPYKGMMIVKCTISGHYRLEFRDVVIMSEIRTIKRAKFLVDGRFKGLLALVA